MKHTVRFLKNKLVQLPRVCSTPFIPQVARKNNPVPSDSTHLQNQEHNVIKMYESYIKTKIKWTHKESDFNQ